MAISLIVDGVEYTFPTTGDTAWGENVTDWAEGVTEALESIQVVGDIGLSSFSIDNNISTPTSVDGLVFDPSSIRGAVINYSVYRVTTGIGATEIAETGVMVLSYKDTAADWDLSRYANNDAGVTFSVTTSGQIQYETTNFTGSAHSGTVTFRAQVLRS